MESALEALGLQERLGLVVETNLTTVCTTPENPDKPVAFCLAYSWNRYLDGRDETRDVETPDENPGARVVTVLESGEAPWVIVTNGKLWRLYSAKDPLPVHQLLRDRPARDPGDGRPQRGVPVLLALLPLERLRH